MKDHYPELTALIAEVKTLLGVDIHLEMVGTTKEPSFMVNERGRIIHNIPLHVVATEKGMYWPKPHTPMTKADIYFYIQGALAALT